MVSKLPKEMLGTIDKTVVGLSNVDNTADLTKPIGSLTQAALDLRASSTYSRPGLTSAAIITQENMNSRRFDLRDMNGLDISGNNDSHSIFQIACNHARDNDVILEIPKGEYVLGSTINITSGTRMRGVGCTPYTSLADGGSRGPGSWFHLAHSNVGIRISDNVFPTNTVLEGIGFYRDQPTVQAGWTPNDHNFDIENAGGRTLIKDVCILNSSRGIIQTSGPAGQLHLDRVYGQPFITGVQIDSSYEGFVVNNLRWWVYWSNDAYTRAYTLANRKGMVLRHCDNASVVGYFNIFSKHPLYIGSHPNGVTNSACFINPEFDLFGGIGIFYEAGSNGSYVKMIGGYSYGNVGNTGAGLESLANNTKTHYVGHKFASIANRAILLDNGQNNVAVVESPEVRDWNLDNQTYEAFATAGNNYIVLDGSIVNSGGNGAPLTNGVINNIASDDWINVTGLSVTSQLGTVTTATGSARLQRRLNSINGTFTVNVTNNGTGQGDLRVTLPVSAKLNKTAFTSGRNMSTGQMVQVTISNSVAIITNPDNTYPTESNQEIRFTAEYEVEPFIF